MIPTPRVRIVHLDEAAFTALAAGDLAAANAHSPLPVSPYLVGAECLGVWAIRRDQVREHPGDAGWVTGIVHDLDRGLAVGAAGFHGPPDAAGMVEIGYRIDPAHRRRGLARAALAALLDRARAEPDVSTVRLTIAPDNVVSQRLATEFGFVVTGEQWDEEDGLEIVHERPAGGIPTPVFDAHLHIVDPRFPLVANDGFLPADFTVENYRTRTADLGNRGFDVVGGAVVSGSFQQFDQTYLLDALERLGPGFVGVTQVRPDCSDAELRHLAANGVRGIRFNLRRGGSAGLDDLETLARTAFDVAGLHAELYVDARDLAELAETLRRLPAVSIDHLGLHAGGLPHLLALVQRGVKVKATGFGRVDLDVASTVRAVLAVDPTALLAGTDLPSTRARRPFRDTDLELLGDVAGEHRAAVLHDNAAAFYRMG